MSIVNILVFQILFIFSLSENPSQKRYISIPFTIPEPDYKAITDSKSFLEKFFTKNVILSFSIGENSQTVDGIIDRDGTCFDFLEEKNVSNIRTNNNFFSSKKSSSFILTIQNKSYTHYPNLYNILGHDYFLFDKIDKYNLTFLLFQTRNYDEVDIDLIKSKKYIAKIGLVNPNSNEPDSNDCPLFLSQAKNIGNLSNYKISFEFESSNKGNFIFGDELYNYKKNVYHESQYVKDDTSEHHQLFYDYSQLVFQDKKAINVTNGTYSKFDYNFGLIIGIEKFIKAIDDNFFNSLMKSNICKYENITFNNSIFTVYSCEEKAFADKVKTFPKIVFSKNDKNDEFFFDFELDYNDLFIKANSRYYFLIIFKKKFPPNTWLFGQPFYKKYNFSMDLDANLIAFYNPNKEIIETDENNNPIKKGEDDDKDKIKKILIIVGLVIFVIGLAVGMFFLGKKLRNDRKKRANELIDDNYDYSAGITPDGKE